MTEDAPDRKGVDRPDGTGIVRDLSGFFALLGFLGFGLRLLAHGLANFLPEGSPLHPDGPFALRAHLLFLVSPLLHGVAWWTLRAGRTTAAIRVLQGHTAVCVAASGAMMLFASIGPEGPGVGPAVAGASLVALLTAGLLLVATRVVSAQARTGSSA